MYNTKKNEGSHVNISMNSRLISQVGLIWGGYFVVMAIFCCVCVGRGARGELGRVHGFHTQSVLCLTCSALHSSEGMLLHLSLAK